LDATNLKSMGGGGPVRIGFHAQIG